MPHFKGWAITGWIAVGLALSTGIVFALFGWTEEALRLLVRITARWAVVLFMLAFAATSLKKLWPSAFTTWLRRNRRYIGVSFAEAHFVHLAFLIILGVAFPNPFLRDLQAITVVSGGLAYAFIAAMTITSFDRTAAWLGGKRWKLLHTAGSYYVWVIFAQTYMTRALADPFFVPFALALFVVLGLRLAIRFRTPRPLAAPPAPAR